MTLFCLILPMAGTDFYTSGVQKRQSFSNWSFLYKYAYYPKPASSSIPLPPALTREARLRKSGNSDLLPVHVMTKARFTRQQRANASRNGQEINEFWLGESKQSLRKERNNFPSLYSL